jgi:hypothetical protein
MGFRFRLSLGSVLAGNTSARTTLAATGRAGQGCLFFSQAGLSAETSAIFQLAQNIARRPGEGRDPESFALAGI